MSTCNRLGLESLGSWPAMPKQLPGHWCEGHVFRTNLSVGKGPQGSKLHPPNRPASPGRAATRWPCEVCTAKNHADTHSVVAVRRLVHGSPRVTNPATELCIFWVNMAKSRSNALGRRREHRIHKNWTSNVCLRAQQRRILQTLGALVCELEPLHSSKGIPREPKF